jgi:hypothetical protein
MIIIVAGWQADRELNFCKRASSDFPKKRGRSHGLSAEYRRYLYPKMLAGASESSASGLHIDRFDLSADNQGGICVQRSAGGCLPASEHASRGKVGYQKKKLVEGCPQSQRSRE